MGGDLPQNVAAVQVMFNLLDIVNGMVVLQKHAEIPGQLGRGLFIIPAVFLQQLEGIGTNRGFSAVKNE